MTSFSCQSQEKCLLLTRITSTFSSKHLAKGPDPFLLIQVGLTQYQCKTILSFERHAHFVVLLIKGWAWGHFHLHLVVVRNLDCAILTHLCNFSQRKLPQVIAQGGTFSFMLYMMHHWQNCTELVGMCLLAVQNSLSQGQVIGQQINVKHRQFGFQICP